MVNLESQITQVIYWTGDFWMSQHGAGLKVWSDLCGRAVNIVEIGANVGYYTVVGGKVAAGANSAYEPHPRSCAALRANLGLNGLERVEVVEAAAVSELTSIRTELVCPTGTDRATPTGAMVRGSSLEGQGPARETEIIPVRAVAFAEAITGCDLVKIDVEGLEAQLLDSARAELIDAKPVVMVEIHDKNEALRALLPQLVRDLEADAYAMRGNHLVPVEMAVLAEGPLFDICRTWDYLIVPAARTAMICGLVRPSNDT